GDLTPQHEELLKAFRAIGTDITEHELGVSDWDHATRLQCDDSLTELRRAAAFCRSILKRNPRSRIGIVIPNLREQRTRAEAVFTEVLHPEFYGGEDRRRAFEISLGEPLA